MNEGPLLNEGNNNYKNGSKIYLNVYIVLILCHTLLKFYRHVCVHTPIYSLSLYKHNVFIINTCVTLVNLYLPMS